MSFTWGVRLKFREEFQRYPADQRGSIVNFLDLYEVHGLSDWSNFPGKMSPSWAGLLASHPMYRYTRDNCLYHYHIGIPEYTQVHPKYKTSDYVLHFQWDGGSHIDLVDTCAHHRWTGEFYLPPIEYLAPIPVEPVPAEPTVELVAASIEDVGQTTVKVQG